MAQSLGLLAHPQPATDSAVPDWMSDAIPVDAAAPADDTPDWMADAIPMSTGPDANQIDHTMEAPAMVRMQVGALDKPEDRLKALQKTYPDAQPYGGDNFIMTDPETKKTIIYNQPNWSPFNAGDVASIVPEIGEGIGGILGAVGGGVGGAAAGTAVPIVGTAAGGVSGAIAGAGAGATAGREATQRSLNYLFGNDDTRTAGEQVGDAAKTFALNAAGEGAGLAVAKGAGALYKGIKGGVKSGVVGAADNADAAAARAIDLRDIGVEPTAGMVNANPATAVKEQALASTSSGKPIQDRIAQAFDAQGRLFNQTVDGLTPQTLSRQELGDALKTQAQVAKDASAARGDELYGRVGTLAGDAPATGNNVEEFLTKLESQRAGLGQSAALNKGPAFEQALAQARAIHGDISGGNATFSTLKDARTSIGALANDPSTDAVLKGHANDLYAALTADMSDTAAGAGDDALVAWKKANNRFRRTMTPDSVFNPKTAIDPIIKAKTPEQAADWVLAQANKGGTRLQAVRRQVENSDGGRDVWNQVTGSVVERMGKSAPDAEFNPNQMARQWNAMSPEAKSALFAGTDRVQYRQNLDRIARVAENLKNYRRMDNHSNTAKFGENLKTSNIISNATVLGVLFSNPVAGAAMVAGKVGDVVANKAYRAMQVKMLTNPETVNWLAGASAASMRSGGWKAHMAKLGEIAANTSDQALATAINDYKRELKYDDKK
ncbi:MULTISPECIES: hypothetical protein [unclassified Rhizobium]|uniref:hypothetical protein n=1 Tax=unclassified Rhizobium TaxID=2613769 RepID=UPI0011605BD2|nr:MULTISPECIES: hypothetical protein [unclassified Rhizobium]TQX87149.1 hypothetical protein EQW76_14920 [Rhizobium sp. rho-13.1]TQY14228.1 hypothetical protein EQW74_13700 [Rhizobium sp. rho-1.1]